MDRADEPVSDFCDASADKEAIWMVSTTGRATGAGEKRYGGRTGGDNRRRSEMLSAGIRRVPTGDAEVVRVRTDKSETFRTSKKGLSGIQDTGREKQAFTK